MRKGWTLQGMADAMGASGFKISKAALGQFEKGDAHPKPATLRAIAKALGVRPSGLMEAEFRLEFLGFRSLASLPGTQRDRIMSVMAWRAERREKLVDASGCERKNWSLARYRVETVEEADEIALMVRGKWDLGLDAIGGLADVFEHSGAEVVEIADDARFSGLSAYSGSQRPFVAVQRREQDGARQRMDLAHELAHLVLDEESPVDEEQFAHRFAGAFLLPRDVVVTELGSKRRDLNIQELKALKIKHGVSIQGWVRRAKDCGVISAGAYKRLCFRIGRAGLRKDEGAPYVTPEAIDRDFRLAARAVTENALSVEDAASLAGVDVGALMEPGAVSDEVKDLQVRSMGRVERRKLAEAGAIMTAVAHQEEPDAVLPDVAEHFDD